MSNSQNSASWQSTWESWPTEGVRNWWIHPIFVTNEILLHQNFWPTRQLGVKEKRMYEVQLISIFNIKEPNFDDIGTCWMKSSQSLIITEWRKRRVNIANLFWTGLRSIKRPYDPSIWYKDVIQWCWARKVQKHNKKTWQDKCFRDVSVTISYNFLNYYPQWKEK